MSNYLKKLEEIKKRAYGTSESSEEKPNNSSNTSSSTNQESNNSSLSVLDRIKSKANGTYKPTETEKEDKPLVSSYGMKGYQKYLDDVESKRNAPKYDLNGDGQDAWWERLLGYLGGNGGGVTDTSMPTAGVTQTINDLRADESYRRPNDDWSDEQRSQFGELYLTSIDKAFDFAEKTNNEINRKKEEDATKEIQDSATSNGWAGAGHTAGAIATAPLGMADVLNDLAMKNAGRDIVPDGNVSPFEYSQAVTGGISEHLNEEGGTIDESVPIIGGKGWGDVYGLGVSTASSLISGYTLGGAGTLVNFMGQAGAAGIDYAKSIGATDEQAIYYGLSVGVFEGVAEMIGIDNLFKLGSSSTLKEVVKNVIKQSITEGAEEGITSIATNVADNIIMQDKSQFNAIVAELMASGMSEKEAIRAAWWESVEGIIFDTVAGSVSGSVSGGIQTGAQNIASNSFAKDVYGNGAELVTEALDIDPSNAYAQKMQGKLDKGKALSGGQINRLVEANENALVSQDKAKMKTAVEARLTELGESGDVSALADIIVKKELGEKLSRSESKLLSESENGEWVADELSTDPTYKGHEEFSNWAGNLGTERINTEAYNRGSSTPIEQARTNPVAKDTTTAKAPTEANLGAYTNAKVTIERDGEAVEVKPQKIASIEGDSMTIELDNGEVVDATEVDFGESQIGLVYQAAKDMSSRVGGFNIDTANVFVRGYNSELGITAGEYIHGFSDAYRFGKLGYPVSELAKGVYTSRLTEENRKNAYNFGKVFGNDEVANKSAKIASTSANISEKDSQKGSAKKKGKVHFDGRNVRTDLNDRQRASLDILDVVAEAMGIDIYVFESPLVNGKRQGENGWYKPETHEMGIDLHAGVNGNALMLYAGSHELGHHIKEVNPVGFKVFADALFEEYGKHGISVEDLIRDKLKFLKKNKRLVGMTEEQAYDLAYEEVVADACEAMLVDSDAIKALSKKVYAKDKGLWQTIKDFITNLVTRVKAAYKGLNPDSREANLVREMEDSAKRLQKLWVEALLGASEVQSSAETTLLENGISVDSNTESGSLFSVRDVLNDADRKKVSKALAERFGVTQEEAVEWLNAETSLASLILNPKYSQYLDYTPDPNEVAIKQNSDYPQGTVDFSPICAKRREFTAVMNNILRLFPNHVFAATDLAKIRTIMQEEGMTIPCGICYVEDRRQLDTIVAQNFIDSLKLYREGSKTRPDGKPFNTNQLNGLKLIDGDDYTPSIYELVSLEGLNRLKEKNPQMAEAWVKFNNARGMQSVRLLANEAEYKRQILKYNKNTVKSKNDKGGLRVYSFSDMEMFHLIDIIQVITDSATVGLSLQGYTKVNEYSRAVKDTGEKLNRSLIPKGDLGYHIEDGKVVLDYDTVEGIDINHPDFFDNIDNPNIGNITIGVSDVQIRAAMVSSFVDQIIPFHTGQSEEVLGEKGIDTWENYKDFQKEKDIATGTASDHQINIYTEVLQVLEKEGKPINKRTFVEKFLQVCKENNLTPRFSQFLNTNEKGEYTYTEGYHKFLVDFKTFDQRTGEYLPQMPVKPIFDNEYMTKILKDYVKSQKVKDAEIAESMPKVIDRITKEIVNPSGNAKYSDRYGNVKDATELSEKDLEYLLEKAQNGELSDSHYIPLRRNTPEFFIGVVTEHSKGKYFIENYPMAATVEHLRQNMEDEDGQSYGEERPHGFSVDDIITISRKMGDPSYIVLQENGRYAEVVSFYNKRNKRVIVSIDFANPNTVPQKNYKQAPYMNGYNAGCYNIVVTQYEADDLRGYLERNEVVYDKTKMNGRYQVGSGRIVTVTHDTPFIEDIIPQDSNSVKRKFSDRDSLGNELSKEQEEFFKDSKVRDENGNLLVMYHGTANSGFFSVFEGDKLNNTSTSSQIGQGFYFTNVKKEAQAYTKNSDIYTGRLSEGKNPYLFETYLNITNPFDVNTDTLDAETIKSVFMDGNDGWFFSNWIPFDLNRKTVKGKTYSKEEIQGMSKEEKVSLYVDYLMPLGNKVILSNMVRAFKYGEQGALLESMKNRLGYDGIVEQLSSSLCQYVAFDSNQIKLTSNKTPSSNPDIRFSDRDSSYMDAVNRGDMETAQRMVDEAAKKAGYTIKAYHGTPIKGITVFDPSKIGSTTDDGLFGHGFYFATDRVTANNYATVDGEVMPVFLDVKKSWWANAYHDISEVAKILDIDERSLTKHKVMQGSTAVAPVPMHSRMFTSHLIDSGYDSVIVQHGKGAYEIVIFDNKKIKSADPVTYDDNGNVIPLSERFNPKNSDIRYSDRTSYAPTFYSHMGKVIDDIKLEKMGASSILNHLKNRGVKDEELKWSGIETFLEGKKSVTKAELQEFIARSQLVIEEEMSSEESWNIVKDGDDYIVKDKDGNILETWETIQDPEDPNLTGWVSLEGGDIASSIEEIREYTSDWYGNESTRWSQYRLDGGTNYRELVFKMPNATHSNRAMRVHWGEDAEGVLVHARIQDFNVDGKKMLFIEELQSDWHNEGHAKGYTSEEYENAVAVYDKLAEDYANKRRAFNKYVRSGEFRSDPDEVSKKKFDWLRGKMDTAEKRMQDAERDVEVLKKKGMGDTPDAPFRSTYHEYVLKRLLRMAAEEGYDSIGWTPSEIQSERWSDEFAEGYRIEYDQDMPKFLRKYGKKWGATVGHTMLDQGRKPWQSVDEIKKMLAYWQNELATHPESEEFIRVQIKHYEEELRTAQATGETVWSMDITDSMKESVLYEGQVLYSDRNTASFKGKAFWSGSVSLLDGVIEETHTIEEAEDADFHHSMYFSQAQIEKMENGENAFFWVDNGNVYGDWRESIPQDIIESIKEQIKVSTPNPEAREFSDVDIKYSIREEAPPRKTKEGYKVFVVRNGKLYPPMVANPNAEDTPVGVWLNADVGTRAPDSKTGRMQVKAGGKGTQGGSGSLAFRPGWHLGETPLATQFDRLNPETGVKELFPENFVWALCDIAADHDYQEEAMSYGYTKNGKFQHSLAGLPKLPTDGYYKYRTNPNPDTVPWLITGAMKVKKLLSDAEVNAILVEKGLAPKQRVGGEKTLADLGLSEYEGKLYSDRPTESFSNRSLLANALESTAQNDIERDKLRQYKEKIDLINAEEQKLHELREQIKELSFAKGARDTERIKSLQFEANQAANRINTYDRQLLNLESTKALKGVLDREKAQARKRAEQRAEQRRKDDLAKAKERAAKTERELMNRYQESRKKGIESRNKTAMRKKIKDVVNELNQYLLNGTKDKHVPIGLQKAVAEALDAVNMDTVNAEERIAKKREEMRIAASKGRIEEVERLVKEIDHIQEMGGNMEAKFSRLKTAYDSIIDSDDPLIANSHDDVISSSIDKVIEVVGNTPLRDMSLYQLEAVHDLYKMVLTSIRNANKAFKAEKGKEISVLANTVIADLVDKKRTRLNVADTKFAWNNLKPVYAFERIGSKTFTKLFNAVRAGEDTWARDMDEAQSFREEQAKKYNFKSWDFKKKYTFTTRRGKPFELDLGEMLSIYAFAKDEHSKGHLIGEGFVFDPKKEVVEKTKSGINIKVNLEDATSYNLSEEIVSDIISKLTSDQKAFADAMQDYLSTTMGEKGNEVSLELYQVKLFKNKVYFPLKVAPQYMAIAKEKAQGEVKIKNKGFTKERKEGAKNPIVLSSFMDVWANHVNEMSMYHAFTLPLEDFYRVFNYKTPVMEGYAPMSVNASIQNAFGEAATSYIEQLLKDLNGGTRSDPRETPFKAMISNFKKASVMASFSVVIQQPSAIVRAQALVDAKHFVGKKVSKSKHKETWAEVKKYAPVAVIKEMGYFDTGMGKSSVEWLKDEKTWKDKMDDILSKAPSLADEYTWCAIWNAVKRETLHNHKDLAPTSEEFLKIVGDRFTEVIVKTQVYDSVLARSANMRSKSTFMGMLTSFLAEPTTSINMLQDAFHKKNKKYIARTVCAVYGSVLLNSALVALVYAMRDDDDDETFLEKYLSSLTTELIDGANPLTYIPFVKDIWSLAQGYDIERADMTLISKMVDSLKQAFQLVGKDTSDMDEEELAEHNKAVNEAILANLDNLSSLLGIPVKNIRRDFNGIINGFNTIKEDMSGRETTAGSLGDSILGDVQDSTPIWGWMPDKSNRDKLYDAIVSGDTAYEERLKSAYKSDSSYNSAIRKALRDNDPRIKEAAEALVEGNFREYDRIRNEIIGEGHFDKDDIRAAIAQEYEDMLPDEETTDANVEKEESDYKIEYIYTAISMGDVSMANTMKENIINTHMANGKSRDDAETTFNKSFTSSVKKYYEEGEISEYEAKNMLINFGGSTEIQATSKVQYWDYTRKNPDASVVDDWFVKYNTVLEEYGTSVANSGISVDMYIDYKIRVKNIDGENKKRDRMYVIDSLPISSYQKDALYFSEDWKRSKLWEAPWH